MPSDSKSTTVTTSIGEYRRTPSNPRPVAAGRLMRSDHKSFVVPAMETSLLPTELDEFPLQMTDVTFRLANSRQVLSMTITRNEDRFFEPDPTSVLLSCGLYCRLETPGDETAPCFNSRHFWSTTHQDSPVSLYLTGESRGFRLALPNAEYRSIHIDERERLLAFLSELRGVELHYTADLHGYMKKDGSDKPQIMKQPFPSLPCHSTMEMR